jgi:uncharacterized protein (TIGR03437 family)
MSRVFLFAFLVWPSFVVAQSAIPIFLGQNQTMLPPTMDGAGRTLVFGSAISSDGTNLGKMDLYTITADGGVPRRLTSLPGTIGSYPPPGAIFLSFSSNAARAAFTIAGSTSTTIPNPAPSGPAEEVHVVDVATGTDRVAAVDKDGCILPLADALCFGCFVTCIYGPHINSDGSKVLYSARRNQPFYVANADGSSVTRLPVYTGSLAPSAQRVISRNGLAVFTSSAPFGPTFAAASTDVYVMNLDGTNIQDVSKFGSNPLVYSNNATISADGSMIAFESNSVPDLVTGSSMIQQPTQIWAVHTDGTGLHAVTSGTEPSTQPSISGDGSLVAFVRNGQLGTVRSDGSNLRVLTKFQMSTARDPVLSEDGSVIVFDIGPPNGGIGALYAINSDGTNLHPVYAPRALNQNGIVGMTFGSSPSPGSLFSAYGLNFSTDFATATTSFPLPPVLAGVSLMVNGRPAPLLAVSPWQINAQLAADVVQGPVAFQLKFADGVSPAPSAADVKNVAPAIFILPAPGNIAPAQAAAFHPNSTVPADATHPAVAGEILEIYGTGLGTTEPPVPAGTPAPASPPARTLVTPQVLFGNIQGQVVFAGLTPGLAGVYQVNVMVPAGLRPGTQVVQWRIDSSTTSNSGTITVQ